MQSCYESNFNQFKIIHFVIRHYFYPNCSSVFCLLKLISLLPESEKAKKEKTRSQLGQSSARRCVCAGDVEAETCLWSSVLRVCPKEGDLCFLWES